MMDPAIKRPGGNAAITTAVPGQPPDAIQSVLCIYCRTDTFVYWPPASRLPSADCPGCQRRITQRAATLPAGTAGMTPRVSGDRSGGSRPGGLPLSRAPRSAREPGTRARSPDSDVKSRAGRRPPSVR